MTRAEAINLITKIDYWGARGFGSAHQTATKIVDRLIAEGVLILEGGFNHG